MKFKQPTVSKFDQLGRVGIATQPASPLASIPAAAKAVMRPRKQYAALEARILFDAAGASAADHQLDNAEAQRADAQRIASEQASAFDRHTDGAAAIAAPTLAPAVGNTVVVIDSRVGNYQDLLAGIDPNATVRVIGANEDGVQVISQLIGTTGNVSSLQIISHGQSGTVYLGNSTLNSAALDNSATAAQLQGWQSGMTANADILILGCDVAKGAEGESFVQKLADLTRADISASIDATGAAAKGGNWVMEFNVGAIESTLVFKAQALTAYGELLVAGPPTTSLTVDPKPLIGSNDNKGSVTFSNPGPIGYAPYIALGFDATGKDPSNTATTPIEGVSYVANSARYLGATLPEETILTFDASGNASTPGIKDNNNVAIIFTAASFGLQAGDQLVILKLPLGSFVSGQPNATVDFKYNVGANADSADTTAQGGGNPGGANKGLPIVSRGFFQLGDTPTGTNAPDFQTGNTTANVDPSWFTTEYRNTSREREQVPGANDKQRFQALLNIALGQTVLSSDSAPFVSKLIIPSGLVFETSDITLRASDAISGAGVPNTVYAVKVVDAAGNPTAFAAVQDPVTRIWTVAPGAPAGAKLEISATTTGGAADVPHTGNLTLNLEYFIPKNVVSNASGGDINANFDAKHTGRVKFLDGDDAQNQAFTVDPAAIVLKYQSIQIQKGVAGTTPDVVDPANPAGVRSGDALTYTLSTQIGDYYGLRDVVVTDVLPDGIDLVGGTATITIVANGETRTGNITILSATSSSNIVVEGATGATLGVGGNGKFTLTFNVSAWLAANPFSLSSSAGGAAGDIYGDVFADAAYTGPIIANTQNGRTDITITYNAVVRDQYRFAPNGNPLSGTTVNENDVLKNDVYISGTLLSSTGLVSPTISSTGVVNSDDSSATVSVKDGALLLEIYAINGIIVTDPGVAKDSRGQPIISPGDNVTYRIRYDTTQGDYTDLKLTAYLPDPVFSATDTNADNAVNGADAFVATVNTGTGPTAAWAQAGAYSLGPNSGALVRQVGLATPPPNFIGVAGTQNPDATSAGGTLPAAGITVTANPLAAGNNVVFNIGTSNRTGNPGSTRNNGEKVDLLFTVKAKDEPFDPELILSAQGNETSQRSPGSSNVSTATPLQDDKIIPIVLGTPKIVVSYGILSKGATGQDGVVSTSGTVTPTNNSGLGTVQTAGTAVGGPTLAGAPFSNIITNAKQIDSDISNVDAGDQVRLGFAIQNTGRSGAYGVRTEVITPPPGYALLGGGTDVTVGTNFQIRRGDGTLLVAGPGGDYTVTGNVVTFTDRDLTGDTIVDPQLASGSVNGVARTDGKNIVIISYDTVAINVAYAGATSISTVGVDRALAGASGTTNFSGVVRDNATLANAKPQVDIRWQGDNTDTDVTATADDSSQQGDGALDTQAVIGEAGFFDLKVTMPEGTTKGMFADINIPNGGKIDLTYNGGAGYEIISTTNGVGSNGIGLTGQLTSNFAGTLTPGATVITNGVGVLGSSGGGARVSLGDVTNTQNNTTGDNSFIIRVRIIVENQIGSQSIVGSPGTAIGSSSTYTQAVDAALGTGGVQVTLNDFTTANDPRITVAEPVVTTVKTVAIVDVDPITGGDQAGTEADKNDIVEYTIVLNNPGPIAAYDLSFQDIFPPFVKNDATLQISSVSSTNAFVGGVATALTAADFALNTGARTLTFDPLKNIDLTANGTITVKVRATLNNTAAQVTSFSNTAETTWTSINDTTNTPSANERFGTLGGALLANGGTTVNPGTGVSSGIGADKALTTAGLNNYRTASSAAVPVVALTPVLSRIGTISDTSPLAVNNGSGDTKDGSPTTGTPQDMVVGELTRFRMVVKVPAGSIPNFALQPTLPTGYQYVGDAKVAFVSDSNMTSSTLGSGGSLQKSDGIAITGGIQADDGSGNSAIWKSVQNSLVVGADVRAATVAPTVAILANTATNGGTPAAPRFELGDISNTDNDIDNEYIVIEFTAVVTNVATNQQGTNLDTSFIAKSGAGAGTQLGNTSNITRDKVVEPFIASIDKSITDIQGGTQGNPTTVTLKDTFTNTGSVPAYDVTLSDPGIPSASGGSAPVFTSLTVGATTYTSLLAANASGTGVTVVSDGANGFNVTVDKLGVNETVTLTYKNDVATTGTLLETNTAAKAEVKYTSTKGASQTFAGSGPVAAERTGADIANPDIANPVANQTDPVNNQVVRDGVGFATISGALWDDTNSADGVIQSTVEGTGTERRLGGLTVTLLWAGADGDFSTTADNRTLTTTTDANGNYSFGALPGDNPATGVNEGRYRITAPTTVTRTDSGDGADTDILTPRYDRTDGATSGLNVAELTLASGTAQATRDFGYIQPNDPPQNLYGGVATFPATPIDSNEDLPLTFNGTGANPSVISITDPDGGRGDGKLSTTVTVTNGTLAMTTTGTTVTGGATGSSTITIEGTQAQINAVLASLVYTPDNNYSGPATVTVTTNDRGQGGNAGGDALLPREAGGVSSPDKLEVINVININVKPVSDAPFLTVGNTNPGGTQNVSPPALGTGLGNSPTATVAGAATGLEDTTIPLGLKVSPTDTVGAPESLPTVTITGVPVGWQLIGGGTTFTSTGTADVFTIPAGDVQLLGIKPLADVNSTATPPATLTIKATSLDGTGNPTAETTGTLTIGVIPVNDRPVVTDTTPIVLASMAEGTANSPVQNVGTLFTPRFSDPKDTAKPNGADTMIGVFVTGSAANPTTEGAWEYFNGTAWVAIPATTTDATAIYLPNATNIRFTPVNSDYSGTPGQLTVRLVENDQTPAGSIIADVPNGPANGTTIGNSLDALAPGAVIDISTPVGVAAAFATGRVSEELKVGIVVTPVSDAPILTIGNAPGLEGANPTTTGVQSSPAAPATGNTAAGTVTGSVRGTEDTPIPLNIAVASADASNPETLGTVVISNVPAGWVIRDAANNVITLTAGATPGLTAAQLAGLTITAPTDVNSVGPVGTNPAATLTITVTSTDGTAPLATTVGTLNVAVTPVNDAPLFPATTTTVLPPFIEDTSSLGVNVLTAFPGYVDAKDAGQPNGTDARVGVLLTNNAATAAQGNWEYFDGANWIPVPRNLTDANALYLPDGTNIRFTPALNYNGTPGNLTARLVENDQAGVNADLPAGATGTGFGSTSTIRPGLDVTAGVGVGGTSRVSANTRDVSISVTPVNDTPVVATPGNTPATALNVGDVPVSFTGANSIVLSDVDTPYNPTAIVTVTITPTTNGRPFISALTSGVTAGPGSPIGTIPSVTGTPIVLTGTLADINATLQNLEYRSAAFYNGNDSFTVQINDNANGGPGPLQALNTVNVKNVPLNDRPVPIGATPDYAAVLPGGTSPGRSIQDMFGVRFTDPRDAPTTNGGDTFAAVAIISTPPASQGIYQYSTDGGSTWIPIAANTTPANALVLGPTALVRFVANPGFIGETTPLQAVLIETDQPNTNLPNQGDLQNRAGIPFDTVSSAPPATGTIINLSTLEATEASTTTNGIGRSRFSSVVRPMLVGIRVDPPVTAQPSVTPIDSGSPLTPLPPVLAQLLATAATPVSAVVEQAQAEAATQYLANTQALNTFGNTGLQPNWIAPDGLPGFNPFTTALPQPEPSAIVDPNVTARRVLSAEEQALAAECAKPRAVVAKPRPAGYVAPPRPVFEPGSPAAKRFSEQLKRARELRAKCAALAA